MENVKAALALLQSALEDEKLHDLDKLRIESAIYELGFLV